MNMTLTGRRTGPVTTCTTHSWGNPSPHRRELSAMHMTIVSEKYMVLDGLMNFFFLILKFYHILWCRLIVRSQYFFFSRSFIIEVSRSSYIVYFSVTELPRTLTYDGQWTLPSARVVSNAVFAGNTPFSSSHSTFLTHFGQFIDHDVISTPSMKGW